MADSMSSLYQGPLEEKDLVDIQAKLKDLDRVDMEINRAKAAGIDVAGFVTQAKDARSQLLKIKQVYFPGR